MPFSAKTKKCSAKKCVLEEKLPKNNESVILICEN